MVEASHNPFDRWIALQAHERACITDISANVQRLASSSDTAYEANCNRLHAAVSNCVSAGIYSCTYVQQHVHLYSRAL
eukprot:5175-Heterococcus_DN1.PRE.3